MNRPSAFEVPFLPPEYIDVIESQRQVLRTIEFPPVSDRSASIQVLQLFKPVFNRSAETASYIKGELNNAPPIARTLPELEKRLQINALTCITDDISLQSALKMASLFIGVVQKEGDEVGAAESSELGRKVILRRARHNATVILSATNILLTQYPGIDEGTNTWQRAVNAHHQNPRLRAPVVLDIDETTAQDELVKRFKNLAETETDPTIKISRSKLITGLRIVKSAVKETRRATRVTGSSSIVGLDNMLERVLSHMPTPMDLEPSEIASAMKTASKMRRYLGSAALIDRTIGADPKAQYYVFLGNNLTGHDVRSQQVVFERDTMSMAKRYSKSKRKK